MTFEFVPWNKRLSEAAYVSPSGVLTEFIYENVSEEFEKKTTAYEFAESDETFVQDLGRTGRRFPLRIFIAGQFYDQDAAIFSDSLAERGIGSLEHPMYGTFNVVPFGLIRRRDDLKTKAAQAVFEVEFWETTLLLFPAAGVDPADATEEAIEESIDTSATTYGDEIVIEEEIEAVSLAERVTGLIDKVKGFLQPLVDVIGVAFAIAAEIQAAFQAIFDSINSAIDTLIRDPLSMAFQMQQMATLPGRSFALISDKLDGYKNLLGDVISGPTFLPTSGNNVVNLFKTDELVAYSMLLGATTSVVRTTFETKTEALNAAETLLAMLDDLSAWRDDNYASLGIIDTGTSYQALTRAVYLGAGFLVQISFTLTQERVLTLDRARTPLDLVAELYSDVEQLDFLINSNGLVGRQIIEVPKGHDIVYYK